MQRRLVAAAVAVISMSVIIGCGSAGTKITRDLLILSEPAGATVYMDGDKLGETPLKVQTFFTWNNDKPYNSLLRRVIQVRKDGYAPQNRDLFPIDMPNITFFLSPETILNDGKGGPK